MMLVALLGAFVDERVRAAAVGRLFRLRGMTRDELLTQLLGPPKHAADPPEHLQEAPAAPEPLVPDAQFWQAGTLPDDLFGPARTPPAPLPKRLGKFPLWRAEEPLLDALEPVYQKAASHGLDLFQSEGEA